MVWSWRVTPFLSRGFSIGLTANPYSKGLGSSSISVPIPETAKFNSQTVNAPVKMSGNPVSKPSRFRSINFSVLTFDCIFHTEQYVIMDMN